MWTFPHWSLGAVSARSYYNKGEVRDDSKMPDLEELCPERLVQGTSRTRGMLSLALEKSRDEGGMFRRKPTGSNWERLLSSNILFTAILP